MVSAETEDVNDYVHVHTPRPDLAQITRGKCPDCERRSAFVQLHTPWYGWDTTCLRCGRNWADGEWIALPFCRTARRDSVAAAKRAYRRGVKSIAFDITYKENKIP